MKALFSLFRTRPAHQALGFALGFLRDFTYHARLNYWVLVCDRNGEMEVATFTIGSPEACGWIERRLKHRIHCLAASVTKPLTGDLIPSSLVPATRTVVIFVPKDRIERARAYTPEPALIVEAPRGFALAWLLRDPLGLSTAISLAEIAAQALDGEVLDFLIPVPGPGGVLPPEQFLKGPSFWVEPDAFERSVELAAPEPEPEPEPEELEESPAPAPASPAQPAVMLGALEDGASAHWAPFETGVRLLNFGILVTGDPGSGKTQTLRVLIDGVAAMGLPVCIFDFKNDYSDRSFVNAVGLKVHDVRRHGIPFNPLMPGGGEGAQVQPIEHIFTITGILKRVFALGDRQTAALRDAMKEAFERRGISPQKWVDAGSIRAPDFDEVVAIMEEQKEAKNPQALSLLDRIAPLIELGLFPKARDLPAPFEAMLDERLVLSLFALPNDEIKAALAELIIIRLHGVLLQRVQPRKLSRLLVIDEAWRVAASAHLENLAREGRAFGAGIAIGTQYPGDLPPNLSGALDTKIYLKNQQPDHKKAVVQALCGTNSGPEAQSLHGVLERLGQFEGLIQNQQYLPFARFKLLPYYKRAKRRVEEQAELVSEDTAAANSESTVDFAKAWLLTFLANGPKDSLELKPAAGAAGIKYGTLYNARKALGVVTIPIANSKPERMAWTLPA
jgi:hypothetical protein